MKIRCLAFDRDGLIGSAGFVGILHCRRFSMRGFYARRIMCDARASMGKTYLSCSLTSERTHIENYPFSASYAKADTEAVSPFAVHHPKSLV